MTPEDLYKFVLLVERDGDFRQHLSQHPVEALHYNGFTANEQEFDTLRRFDWNQPLGDLEVALNRELQEASRTSWGTTKESVSREWGSIIDVELLPGKTVSDLEAWLKSAVVTIYPSRTDYGFERLFSFHSSGRPTLFSLVAAWQNQESATRFQSILAELKLESVASFNRVHPSFQVLSRVATEVPAAGGSRNFGILQTWQLLPGADGLRFRDNRFKRYSLELAVGRGLTGAILGWVMENPTIFHVIAGYNSMADYHACLAAPGVGELDGANEVGSIATLVSSSVCSIAPWVTPLEAPIEPPAQGEPVPAGEGKDAPPPPPPPPPMRPVLALPTDAVDSRN